MNKLIVFIIVIITLLICYSSSKKCIKPWSIKQCEYDSQCCFNNRPVSCVNGICVEEDCFTRGNACEHNLECCSGKCKFIDSDEYDYGYCK